MPKPTGNQIKAARHLAGLSQEALAKAGGITRQTLAQLEGMGHSEVKAHYPTIGRILAALGRNQVALTRYGCTRAIQNEKAPAAPAGQEKPKRAGANAAAGVHPANERQFIVPIYQPNVGFK